MRKRTLMGYVAVMTCVLGLSATSYAGDAPKKQKKMVWTVPVYLAEGLQLKKATPATAELLDRALNQCIDDTCKAQVAKCKASPRCVLTPPAEALKENRMERGDFGKQK